MSIFDVRITVHDIVEQCIRDCPSLSSVDYGAALHVARTTLRHRDIDNITDADIDDVALALHELPKGE
jgi:rRNA maturation endonuclease Nob1